jgi:phosphomannomutase
MKFNSFVFKAYDIRGVYPSQINESFAISLGMAFGTQLLKNGEKSVSIGRDGRISGPSLLKALSKGLQSVGVDVFDIDLCTTPMLYFAAHTITKSGIQITGSHNPKDYNGFKMVMSGQAMYGQAIKDLHTTMEDDPCKGALYGSYTACSIYDAYKNQIKSTIHLKRPIRVVIDSGNGVAGAFAPQVFRDLGCQVIELFSEVDGHFPNHHPDPSKPENLKDLIDSVKANDAELGFAFDGDGDRLGVVSKSGENIYPDRQMQLFSKDVLSRVPGGTIVFDVKCSQRLGPFIAALGGVPLMFKTGHSLIKAKMKEIDSPLGGEMSGHIFFKERWFGFDDGTYAGARLLEILSAVADGNDLLNALENSCSTPELNIAVKEGEAPVLIEQLIHLMQSNGVPSLEHAPQVNTIDGLRIDWEDGFGLIRGSNTTPVLVLRFEGQTKESLERIQLDMLNLLRGVLPDAKFTESQH